MRTEDLQALSLEQTPAPSLTVADRLQILSLCQGLVVEKKFGIWRLVDLCSAFETYVVTGAWPLDFAAHYQTLIQKQGFPYRGPSPQGG